MKHRVHSEYFSTEKGASLKIEALTDDMQVLCGLTLTLKDNNISVGQDPDHILSVYSFESTESQGQAIRAVSDLIAAYVENDKSIKRYIHAMILGWFAAEEWKSA